MKAFYGSRFSKNQTMTPDGFLVAHNVPISRAGWYEYLGNEIGAGTDDAVKVYRDPDEVFSPSAMASFEGKPLVDGHPPSGVDPSNAQQYTKGAVQNVRQGKGGDSDLLLADLIVYDGQLIKDIQSGKREVSAGYECEYVPNEDGTYSQRSIVGNHVAVVENGRAGDRVRIQDSKHKEASNMPKGLTLPSKKQKQSRVTDLLAAFGLKHFATDAEPEQIMDAVDAMAEERAAADETPEPTGSQSPDTTKDADPALAALTAQVQQLTAVVAKLVQAQGASEQSPEDSIDAAIAQLENPENTPAADDNEEESHTIDPSMVADEEGPVSSPEDRPKNPITGDNAYKIAALKAMKPILAAIPDPVERKKAADAAIASIKGRPAKNTYADIDRANRKKAKDANPAQKQPVDHSNLGREWAKKFNPHYKEKA